MKNRILLISFLSALLFHLCFILLFKIKTVHPVYISRSEMIYSDNLDNLMDKGNNGMIYFPSYNASSDFIIPGDFSETVMKKDQMPVLEILDNERAEGLNMFNKDDKLLMDSMSFIDDSILLERERGKCFVEENFEEKGLFKSLKKRNIYITDNLSKYFDADILTASLIQKGLESGKLYNVKVVFMKKNIMNVVLRYNKSVNRDSRLANSFREALKTSIQVPKQINGAILISYND